MKHLTLYCVLALCGLCSLATQALTLSWLSGAGSGPIDAYYIYGATNVPSGFTLIATTTNTSYSTNWAPAQYYFYVTSSNFWGESGPSNVTNTPVPVTSPTNTNIKRVP